MGSGLDKIKRKAPAKAPDQNNQVGYIFILLKLYVFSLIQFISYAVIFIMVIHGNIYGTLSNSIDPN